MAEEGKQGPPKGVELTERASGAPSIIFLADTRTYRLEDFAAAARKLGADLLVGSDRCHVLAGLSEEQFLIVDFDRPREAARRVVEYARATGVDAIVPGGDRMAVVSALASAELGLPHHSPEAALTAGNKRLLREALAGLGPAHHVFRLDDPPTRVAGMVSYPCVLKPLRLSASRGVIRANDPDGLARARLRIEKILRSDAIRSRHDPENELFLVEEFVPGREVALEGLMSGGSLRTLALFDKPDPLDGPFFEETIYVTPSRHPPGTQQAIARQAERAARAIGLAHGPVHAELRFDDSGVSVIEVAARTIGGLCSRALRFGLGVSLEEIVLRHALGEDVSTLERERQAAGVMMIPVPRAGILKEVLGIETAKRVEGIEAVEVTMSPGQVLVPLPEGTSYLGFLFARGEEPAAVERSLRLANGALSLRIAPSAPSAH